MAYTVRINGFEVVAETAEEVKALVGLAAVAAPAPAKAYASEVPTKPPAPTGCITPNGRGYRWQFSLNGTRHRGPTVEHREEAEAGLAAALKTLAEKGRPPEPDSAGPMPGTMYDSETWRDVHRFDKRMQAAISELERLRPYFDVLPPAMRQAVEARLSGAYPAQIAEMLGKRVATVSQAIWDARHKLRAAARADGKEPPTRRGRKFTGGYVKAMPDGKFRWQFTYEGEGFWGMVVPTAEEAERHRILAVELILNGDVQGVRQRAYLDRLPAAPLVEPTIAEAPPAEEEGASKKTKRQRRCGKCDGLGHFAKTCKRSVPSPDELAEPEAGTAPPLEPELIRVKPPQPPPEPVHLPQRPASASRAGVATLGAFGAYSADVGRFGSVLPRDEEQRIAKEYRRTGDKALADRLVQSNLRLVLVIAREYKRGQHRIDDLVQEGNCGLIHAVGKFDPERGIKLSSYASFWIRAYILKFILTQHRLVRVGTTQAQRKMFFSLRKEREKLEKDGQTADPEVLAAALGVTVEELAEMDTRMGASETSIDAHTFDGDGASLGDRLPASPDVRPDVQAEAADLRHQLRHKLKAFERTLNTRQRALLREHLLAEERATLDEIAERFGVSRQRMLQIKEKLKDDLRDYLVDQMDIESLVA